jgi:hypothetical protein
MFNILLRGYICSCSLTPTHHCLIATLEMWRCKVIQEMCTLFPFAVLDNTVFELCVMP